MWECQLRMLYSHKIYEPENNRVQSAAANVYVNINQNPLISHVLALCRGYTTLTGTRLTINQKTKQQCCVYVKQQASK